VHLNKDWKPGFNSGCGHMCSVGPQMIQLH
jgi:hypothetical protein